MCVIVLQWKYPLTIAIASVQKWKLGQRFLCFFTFFDMALQNEVFWILKNVKNWFSNYAQSACCYSQATAGDKTCAGFGLVSRGRWSAYADNVPTAAGIIIAVFPRDGGILDRL